MGSNAVRDICLRAVNHTTEGVVTALMVANGCCAYLVSAASAAAWLLLAMVR